LIAYSNRQGPLACYAGSDVIPNHKEENALVATGVLTASTLRGKQWKRAEKSHQFWNQVLASIL